MKCRSCGSEQVHPFLSLGTQPLANNLVKPEDFVGEPRFPLDVVYCEACTLVQLSDESFVPRDVLFSHYAYASSLSGMKPHFETFAGHLKRTLDLKDGSLVVDIGSSDGVFLRPLEAQGLKAVGVEPAENLAKMANEQGLTTLNAFFGSDVVKQVLERHGAPSVITASNVIAHVGDIHDTLRNVHGLLKEGGVFVPEIQYLGNTVADLTVDNVYHEHVFYYSLLSLSRLLERHGLFVFRAERVPTHGGSLRVYASKGARTPEGSVRELAAEEERQGLARRATYDAFADRVRANLHRIGATLKELYDRGDKMAGYGAPAKSSTLLNSIPPTTPDLPPIDQMIDYVVDDSPVKQGFYTPGTHLKIVSSKTLEERKPDVIVIFAWNYAENIMRKCAPLRTSFLVPLPELRVVPAA